MLRKAYLFLSGRPLRCPACGHPYHADSWGVRNMPNNGKCVWS